MRPLPGMVLLGPPEADASGGVSIFRDRPAARRWPDAVFRLGHWLQPSETLRKPCWSRTPVEELWKPSRAGPPVPSAAR